MRKARLRAEKEPAEESQGGSEYDGGNKVRSDAVGEALHGRAAALRFADEFHDLREHRFTAHALRFHDETAAGVQGAAGDAVGDDFFDRHWFAGDH